jgi:pyridoxine 5-phosphate synthase
MSTLSVNIDHVATLRQARGGVEPDPVTAAALAEIAGADGIIVHLREDRRHIQDRDLTLLRQTVQTRLNLEMAATDEMIGIALNARPFMCTLVPEKRAELTTEGGLDVAGQVGWITETIGRLQGGGIKVSLFIDADPDQIEASVRAGADFVEIHTGHYADAAGEDEAEEQFQRIKAATESAHARGLRINVGHGLNYTNIKRFQGLAHIEDYSIGHAIVSRAVMVGISRAVREMADLVRDL